MSVTAPDRIYAQYRNKPKALAWYNIVCEIANELDTVYRDVQRMLDIDNNVGEQLDIIGRIVGITRDFEAAINFDADQFGGDNNEQFGGAGFQFKPFGQPTGGQANDSLFRLILKSKIAKNNSDVTIDSIIQSLLFITSQTQISLVDNEDMTFSLEFGGELTTDERFILDNFDVVPKPQGVRFTGYTEASIEIEFDGVLEFGDPDAEFT